MTYQKKTLLMLVFLLIEDSFRIILELSSFYIENISGKVIK